MKKIITIDGKQVTVNDELRLLGGMKLMDMVAQYNALVPEEKQVKKFVDKATAAARLFAVLPEAPETVSHVGPQPGSVKTILRELYAEEFASYTLDELLERCNCQKKVLMDDLARLKNPKYAGKSGVLVIVRNGDVYSNAADLTMAAEQPDESPAGEPIVTAGPKSPNPNCEDGTEGDNSMADLAGRTDV